MNWRSYIQNLFAIQAQVTQQLFNTVTLHLFLHKSFNGFGLKVSNVGKSRKEKSADYYL